MSIVQSLVKYALEGSAVAVAAYFIPQRKMAISELVMIALTAAAIFAVLDYFAPAVGIGTRQGMGFGIGMRTVGWEGFEDSPNQQSIPSQ
ncbi:MAG: hypothetical protein ACYCOU_02785 [Sulfobacillus sp.]